ncbi:MAG: alpha/beta hydrolase [Acidimicrobiales bacterium]
MLSIGVCLTSCSGPGATDTQTRLTYCAPGGVGQSLDLYTPIPAPTSPVATVVYVHGGGWTSGNDQLSPFMKSIANGVIASGMIFVSLNYRLAPRYRWPDQIEDVKCAIRFLRQNAKRLRVDPASIGAIGDSAGAQLVEILGLAGPSAGFDVGQYASESSSVKAVVDLYGPSDLTTPDWAGYSFLKIYAQQEFGQQLGQPTKELATSSAISYIRRGAPPFLIIHGVDDTIVPVSQSQDLARRLTAAGDAATLVLVRNAGHGLIHAGSGPTLPSLTQLRSQIVDFLSHELGQQAIPTENGP